MLLRPLRLLVFCFVVISLVCLFVHVGAGSEALSVLLVGSMCAVIVVSWPGWLL